MIRNLVFLIIYPVMGIVFDAFGAYWLYANPLGGNFLGGIILLLAKQATASKQQSPEVEIGALNTN